MPLGRDFSHIYTLRHGDNSHTIPVEVKGEDGLLQQPLLHQSVQRRLNSAHSQSREAEAQNPIKGDESKDQAGLPQSLSKCHRSTVDPSDLGIN